MYTSNKASHLPRKVTAARPPPRTRDLDPDVEPPVASSTGLLAGAHQPVQAPTSGSRSPVGSGEPLRHGGTCEPPLRGSAHTYAPAARGSGGGRGLHQGQESMPRPSRLRRAPEDHAVPA
eukprot:scaffold1293_cov375-Prasinococcus_capsulatus_cf.AAC.4